MNPPPDPDDPPAEPGLDDEADDDVLPAELVDAAVVVDDGDEDDGDEPSEGRDSAPGSQPTPRDWPLDLPDLSADTKALVRQDSLKRYLAEIQRYAILDRDEEHELAVAYVERQDVDAAFRLLTSNLRLVVMLAREYQRNMRNLLDLIQEGNIGLMEALKRYDPYRGVRFPSYAAWWIRAYMIRYLINNYRLVKIGTTQAQRKLFFKLNQEKAQLERMGITPGPKLLAERLSVKESEVIEMDQRMSSPDASVDAPLGGEEGGTTMLGVLPAAGLAIDDAVADQDLTEKAMASIHEMAESLEGKEKAIFERRLLSEDPETLAALGEEFGVTRERVRQIEKRLIEKMRKRLTDELGEVDPYD